MGQDTAGRGLPQKKAALLVTVRIVDGKELI
jgi:hypothetical protein